MSERFLINELLKGSARARDIVIDRATRKAFPDNPNMRSEIAKQLQLRWDLLFPEGRLRAFFNDEELVLGVQREIIDKIDVNLKKGTEKSAAVVVTHSSKDHLVGLNAISKLPPSFRLLIDPGTASKAEIADPLTELSVLYRMLGGSGISFTNMGTRQLTGELL